MGNLLGLCGVLDGDYKNDFIRKDGIVDDFDFYYYLYLNEFLNLWRYV